MVAVIGTSDRPCWQAEACEILLLLLIRNISHCFRPGKCSAELLANTSAESCNFEAVVTCTAALFP